MFQLITVLIVYLPIGIFCGLSSKNLSIKKGRSGKEGFILGFILSLLGIMIIYFLPTKNDFQPNDSLFKRILLGVGRLIIFSVLFQIIFTEYLSQSDFTTSLLYPLLKSYSLIIGPLWVLRGNTNFLNLN
tara:strand:+ start:83 stop:472 length:390 start_codon:yes stop_codon:yes gene_type:complete